MKCVINSVWKVHKRNIEAKIVTFIIASLAFPQHSRITHFPLEVL
jgi:hypothetical protein